MKNRHIVGTIIAAILVIALAVILAASYFILKNYVVVGLQLFPRNRETLDLRMAFPDATLSELAGKHDPPITKSGVNHRLKKLTEFAKMCGE